ncbi:MAG: hypothetical protein AAF198_06165 [Pseudomonadota bacterium]
MNNYREMTLAELVREAEIWDAIINSPKGPESATNAAREAAIVELGKVEMWMARHYITKETQSDSG